VRVEPHVDALHVEQVPARRQLPHHLAGLDVLQAHGAQRAPPGLAAAAAALRATRGGARVGERRQRFDRRVHQPARRPRARRRRRRHRRRKRGTRPAAARAAPGDASGGAEHHHGRAGERARLGEADCGGEGGEQEQRRGGDDDAVAGEGAVVGAGARRRRRPSAVQDAEHPYVIASVKPPRLRNVSCARAVPSRQEIGSASGPQRRALQVWAPGIGELCVGDRCFGGLIPVLVLIPGALS
jgi:hypothetical protein